MRIFTFTSLLLIGSVALAAEHGHGEGVPVRLIVYQAINVIILFGALVYFLKKPVREHFLARRAAFLAEAAKSQAAKDAAEKARKEISDRLSQLENSREESISRAKADAADLRNQLLADAQAMSKRIQDEAKSAAINEIERAKKELREELLKEAVLAARKELTSQVSSSDQQRLQDQFISNIKTVQP